MRNLSSVQRDRVAGVSLGLIALLLAVLVVWMLSSLLSQGLGTLSWSFLVESPLQSGRSGGIAPILVSTAWILAICLATVILLGTGCALYLSESLAQNSRLARLLSRSLDVLAGIPSIVYGLFGYLFFAQLLGLGFSIASGGLTLACMALPLYVRLAEQAFRQCPHSYRQAAQALALSESSFIVRILLPASAPGLSAAIIVAAGRALAETAVLIFTAGYVTRMPDSVMDSGRAMSLHIYDLAVNVPGGGAPAAATALVLTAILILFNISARRLGIAWSAT
ncbi:MAG: phosphate ABC transporter permease PstA [Oceanococcus sp.]